MRITQECNYAIRIMAALGRLSEGEVMDAAAISEQQNIPSRFTVKILRKLVLAKLIHSRKGAGGGYALKGEPKDITLKDIVEVIDGPIVVNKCMSGESKCAYTDKAECSLHNIMAEINEHIIKKLESVSLQRLV